MAELIDAQTGQRVVVPDDEAPQGVLSGKYGVEKGRDLVLMSPQGTPVRGKSDDAIAAFKAGYTFGDQTDVKAEENAAKYGTLGAKLLAAGTGALRGPTLGLSDRVLRNLGVEEKTLRDIQEGAPITSGVAEFAGTAAAIVGTGGAGGIGQAAARGVVGTTAKGALKKAAGKAIELGVSGAIEGAAIGAGKAVSEDALGRADLTAESLLANTGTGALVGLGGGVILGGGASLIGSGAKAASKYAASKIGSGSVKEWLENFANESAVKAAVGQNKKAWKDIEGKELTDKAGKYIRETIGLDNLDNTESLAPKLAARAEELEKKLGDMVARLDDTSSGGAKAAREAGESLAGAKSELSAAQKAAAEALDAEKAAIARAKSYGDAVSPEYTQRAAAAKEAVRQAESKVSALAKQRGSQESLVQRVRGEVIADRIENELLPNIDPITQKSAYNTISTLVDDYRSQKSGFLSFDDARIARAKAQDNGKYNLLDVTQHPTAEAWQNVAKIWNDEIDRVAEPLLLAKGEQTSKAYKSLREEYNLVKKISDYAQDRVEGNLSNRRISPTDYASGMAALATTADPVLSGATAFAHKQIRERGSAFAANMAAKASRLKWIQKASEATANNIDSAIGDFVERALSGATVHSIAPISASAALKSESFVPAGAAAKDSRDVAKEKAKQIALTLQDPEMLANRIATSLAGIDEAAPTISGKAAETATRALNYLHTKAPRPPRRSTNTLQPFIDEWKPTNREADSFAKRVRAVEDPLSVLRDMASGRLTAEGAETLREVYPQLHQMAAQKVAEKLATAKKRLPYPERVALSLLLDAPVDDSMRPEFIKANQDMWAQKPAPKAGGRGGGGGSNIGMAEGMASMTQKLEGKR